MCMRLDELKVGDCFKYTGDYFVVLDEWNGKELLADNNKLGGSFSYFCLSSTLVEIITEQEFMEKENAGARD